VSPTILVHSPALCGLTANPAVPVDLLGQFIAAADAELCLDLADRDDLSPAQARTLAARGGPDTAVRLVRRRLLTAADLDARIPAVVLALLDETDAPESWMPALRQHPDPMVRAELANAAHVPADILADLAEDPEPGVVAAVADSAALTAELAQRLAGHPHLTVRRAVAGNQRTPPPVLTALATGSGLPPPRWCAGCDGRAEPVAWTCCARGHETALIDLAYALAINPTTPPQAVAGYTEHTADHVRWALAERPHLLQQAYRALADDPVPGCAARWPKTPPSTST
jgi:hypothetical protein